MSYCFQCNVSMKYEKQNLEFMKLEWFKCDFRTPHVYIENSLVGVEKPILTLMFLVLLFHKC